MLAAGVMTPSVWLNSHKYRVDIRERFRVLGL